MNKNPETNNTRPEREHNKEALEQAGIEHRERLREQLEHSGERQHEHDVEGARHEALERAHSAEKEQTPTTAERQPAPTERRGGRITKAERDTSFNTTMNEVRTHMSGPERAFSKVIHAKAVETVSEAAGNSIARPNAILSGAIFAFALTLVVYLIAKNLGYPLSGFETIAAFLLGWALGIVYDFLKVMITGRK